MIETYLDNDKILPNKILINYLYEYIEINKLNKYVNKIIIGKENGYIPSKKEIYLSFNKLILKDYKKNGKNIYNINLLKLLLSFHELAHVEQIKYMNTNYDQISNILKLSYYIQLQKNEIYSIIHDLFPHEYNAEINALLKLKKILNYNEIYDDKMAYLFINFINKNYIDTNPNTKFLKYLKGYIPEELLNTDKCSEYEKFIIGSEINENTKKKIRSRSYYGERNI